MISSDKHIATNNGIATSLWQREGKRDHAATGQGANIRPDGVKRPVQMLFKPTLTTPRVRFCLKRSRLRQYNMPEDRYAVSVLAGL